MDVQQSYAQWLKDFASDPETVAELESIRGNDAEIEDRFYTELSFGTAGMRGVLGAGTNRMNALQRAPGHQGPGRLTCIPSPARRSGAWPSPMTAAAAQRPVCPGDRAGALPGRASRRTSLTPCGPCPSSPTRCATWAAAAGVVITASHNPPRVQRLQGLRRGRRPAGARRPPRASPPIIARPRPTPPCVLMDMEAGQGQGPVAHHRQQGSGRRTTSPR